MKTLTVAINIPVAINEKINFDLPLTPVMRRAIEDWCSNIAYWDGRNFRLKSVGKPIAPWNKEAKRIGEHATEVLHYAGGKLRHSGYLALKEKLATMRMTHEQAISAA